MTEREVPNLEPKHLNLGLLDVQKLCVLTGCYKKYHAHNLCLRHYQQWSDGCLMFPRRPKYLHHDSYENALKAIKESCEISKPFNCWLSNDTLSYKQITYNGKFWLLHRLTWMLYYGSAPKHTLDHLCRKPSCCNPQHLEDVTMRVNLERRNTAQEILAENRKLKLLLKELGISYD